MSDNQNKVIPNPLDRLSFLRDLGFKPRTILDIGAFMGEWTRQVHKIWPEAKIFMIEANEDCHTQLARVKEAVGFEIALLGKSPRKEVEYFAAKNPLAASGNSIYREQTHQFEDCEVRKRDMQTLDSVVAKNKLENIDFVKIDTQGSELEIIAGGEKTIAEAEFILLETQNLEYNLGAPKILEVMTAMNKLGFMLFDIPEIHYLNSGFMVQADLLFARENSRFIKRGLLCCDTNSFDNHPTQYEIMPAHQYKSNSVVIYCPPNIKPWSPNDLHHGIGGSEEAVIYLSQELVKLGWDVSVFSDLSSDDGDYDGVHYQHYLECNWANQFNIFIVWRDGRVFNFNPRAKASYLWLHDVPVSVWYTPEKLHKMTKIITLSYYHRSFLPLVGDDKILISSNGLNADFLKKTIKENKKIKRDPHALFYGSSYDRGLEHLLKMWPLIKEKVPDATLHLCYGWGNFLDAYRNEPPAMAWYQQMEVMIQQDGIIHHGRVGHPELEKIMLGCGIFAYPCHFEEISCITAMRAQVLGCVPVTIDNFALSETVQYGIKVKGDIRNPAIQATYLEELVSLMLDTKRQENIRQKMMTWALNQFDWKRIAKEWTKEFYRA